MAQVMIPYGSELKKPCVMKKSVFLLFVFTALFCGASAQNHSLKNLVGKWESADGAGFEVIDSSRIFLTYMGERKQISSYQADFSKTPCWFDFTIKEGSSTIELKSLLLFVNENLLQWQVFEEERPLNFNTSVGNILNLKRRQ